MPISVQYAACKLVNLSADSRRSFLNRAEEITYWTKSDLFLLTKVKESDVIVGDLDIS